MLIFIKVTAQGSKILQNYEENYFLHVSIAVNETVPSAFVFLPLLNRNIIYPPLKPKKKQKRKKKKAPSFDPQCDREPVVMKTLYRQHRPWSQAAAKTS